MNVFNLLLFPDMYESVLQALAGVDFVLREKDLKDPTLTLADWVERKRLADKMVQLARAVTLEAERALGKCLIEAKEGKGMA